MNYKKIIKSQRARLQILSLLRWMPDSIMLRLQYRIKTGIWPNFNKPKRFTEKLQLYKMYYHNPLLPKCVDKYEVRQYVKERGLGWTLNDIYGVYNTVSEIDFDSLPSQFVIKSTTGGGGLNVIVVKDKKSFNMDTVKEKAESWVKGNIKVNPGREWAYDNVVNSRVLVEKYLQDPERGDLVDYKFFCFNGKVKFLYVISDRKSGEYAYLGVYDTSFNKLPVYRCDERRSEKVENRPKNFDKMLKVAELLSSDFPHVRVDLYNIDGTIFFGELTFYDGSGYFHYEPDSFDFEAGSYFTEY